MSTLENVKVRDSVLDFKTEKASFGRYGIHDYPAMLHYLVVRETLKKYGTDKKVLYDPFCGSGVSLCEGLRSGLTVYGTDINPLALVIAQVRCSSILDLPIVRILDKIKHAIPDVPKVKNIDYWFKDYVVEQLGKIRAVIKEYKNESFYELLLVAFSQTIREVSNNRKNEFKRYRLNNRKLINFNPSVLWIFEKNLTDYFNRLRYDFIHLDPKNVKIYKADTRKTIPFRDNVDIVITSPPYGDSKTTVSYGQFSSFSLEWLTGLNPFGDSNLRLDNESLGGKINQGKMNFSETLKNTIELLNRIDTKRATEVGSFFYDLFLACKNVSEKLNQKAIVCFVVGNRMVRGIQIPMDDITREMFEYLGLKHMQTSIREIHNKRMPLQNSPSNIAGEKSNTMKYEYIVLMEKKN